MSIDRAQPLNSLGPWALGVNNVAADYELPPGSLRDAVNVDITLAGSARRRKGWTSRYNGAGAHSMFSDGTTLYGVDGQTLSYWTRQSNGSLVPTAIRGGFPKSRPITYLPYLSPLDRHRIYYSNGIYTGMLIGVADYPWGVERPNGQPTLAASASGALNAGTYQVACTFTSLFGEESGTDESARVNVAAGGGIMVSNIPQPAQSSVTRARLYCSTANGNIPYLYAVLPVGATNAVIGGALSDKKGLETQFMRPPPAGEVMALHYGRVYIASGPVLYWTDTLRPGGFWHSNSVVMPAPITLLGSTDAGLVIASDKTYFMNGTNPQGATLVERLPHGAFKGSLRRDERRDILYWFSPRGLCMATNDGQVTNLTDGRLALANSKLAPALIREGNGLRQYMATLRGGVPDPLISETAS